MDFVFSILHPTARVPDGWRAAYEATLAGCDTADAMEYILCVDERDQSALPLFGGPMAAVKPATPPMPAPRPASIASVAPAPQAAAPAPRVSEPVAQARAIEPALSPAAAPAPVASKKDPIGALIKGEGIPDPVAPTARVAAVQKALIKSGFVLRADGAMGAATRQALERFEQERRLPVTGDLSPRTLRELTAQSGVSIP